MPTLLPELRVQDIDHGGIVAGIIDSLDLVEQINQQLGTDPQAIASPAQAVKAMILNGLGFVSARLYLFEKLFGRHCHRALTPRGDKARTPK